MEVQFTPEQEALVREAIKANRLNRAEDAIQQALSLWETRERNRLSILAALDEAEMDLQTGQYADFNEESSDGLSEQLKVEARLSRDRRLP